MTASAGESSALSTSTLQADLMIARNVFSSAEIERLGYYVYLYSDPANGQPFYVGKGIGNRVFSHLKDSSETQKVQRIAEIRSRGQEPKIEILAFGLDEETAFKVEAAAIDLVGFENLTNAQIGRHARQFGRKSIDAIHAELDAKPIDRFEHDLILIKLNASYRAAEDDPMALYDATRGTWRVDHVRASRAEYAAPVFGGVIREVYSIAAWLPAESTLYADLRQNEPHSRWEFVGRIAPSDVRDRYQWKSVAHLFPPGSQNPIRYVDAPSR